LARKPRRTYQPRILGDGKVMMPADLKRLHKQVARMSEAKSGTSRLNAGRDSSNATDLA
jgi:hypothetical protein